MRPLTRDELLALPAVVDVVQAGRAWGLGRTKTYQLVEAGRFPCPVQRLGSRYRVVTAHLLASLAIDMATAGVPTPAAAPATTPSEKTRGHRFPKRTDIHRRTA